MNRSSADPRRLARALLLDRDGTVNVDRGWVHKPEDFSWVDGAREAIRWANDRDILVLVITNWGAGGGFGPADIAPPGGDGVVNIDDLVQVITHWGACP